MNVTSPEPVAIWRHGPQQQGNGVAGPEKLFTREDRMVTAKILLTVLLLAGLWALPSEAQRQCAADRPCLGPIYNQGANLIVEWSDPGRSNHWNFGWSRDGIDV